MKGLLKMASCWSDDQDTQTSAILTQPSGRVEIASANTLTKGVAATPLNTTRPGKVPWVEHSERNAIYAAARLGIATAGLHLYMRWFPCAECARAIAQSGIAVLYCDPKPDQCEKYHFDEAAEILAAAGVEIKQI